jgi:hypothetical protein
MTRLSKKSEAFSDADLKLVQSISKRRLGSNQAIKKWKGSWLTWPKTNSFGKTL